MMNDMMGGAMTWGMGLFGLLLIIVLVVAAIALANTCSHAVDRAAIGHKDRPMAAA